MHGETVKSLIMFSVHQDSPKYAKKMFFKGNGENYIMRNLVICTPYPVLCGWKNREE